MPLRNLLPFRDSFYPNGQWVSALPHSAINTCDITVIYTYDHRLNLGKATRR